MALRVVLVDDDARFRATARRSLSADGVEVVAEVADGEHAVATVEAWQPDVVLLDIALPGVDGLEVARRLRAIGSRAAVVLVSSRDATYGRRVSRGLAAGFVPKDQLSLAAILAVTGGAP
jgi:DNA-binding NarL/FixJ family response regulator